MDVKTAFAAALAALVILNGALVKASTEENDASGVTEEDTMLNIMPKLSVPKRVSTEYSASQQFVYVDNYFETIKNKEGRLASVSSPGISVKYPISDRSYLKGDYAYGYTYYLGKNSINRHEASVKAYHRPTRRFSMGLTEEFIRSDSQELEEGIDIKTAGVVMTKNTLKAEAKYELNKKLRIGAGTDYSLTNFEETAAGTSPNTNEITIGGDMEYLVSKNSVASLIYNFCDTFFKGSGDKDSYKNEALLRYVYDIAKAVSVGISGGYETINYRSGQEEGGVTAGLNLDYKVSRFTQANFRYEYSIHNSLRDNYLGYIQHGFSGDINHYLTPRVIAGASASAAVNIYNSSAAVNGANITTDKASFDLRARCFINYKLTKWIDAGAEYFLNMKFSDFADDEYISNHYIVNMKVTF